MMSHWAPQYPEAVGAAKLSLSWQSPWVDIGVLCWVGADGNRAGLGLEWGFHLCCNGLTSPSLAAAWVV